MKQTRKINSSAKREVAVAINSPATKEGLPLPWTHYPCHYGTFFCFSETKSSDLFLCECTRKAVENHFHLRAFEDSKNWSDENISAPLSSHFFPKALAQKSLICENEANLKYQPKLCHRCNLTTPTLRYCHEMYGGKFKQFFGWYIDQASFRMGVRGLSYIPNYTPAPLVEEIEKIKAIRREARELSEDNSPFDKERHNTVRSLQGESAKLERKLHKFIENVAREEFGFRKVGEANVSEMILVRIVRQIFSNEDVLIHHRPEWLSGLELDVFIPKKSLGIEYQGQQHFHAIKAWGGKRALEAQRARDEKKRTLSKSHGIKLLEVDYTEPLEIEYIKNRIESFIRE